MSDPVLGSHIDEQVSAALLDQGEPNLDLWFPVILSSGCLMAAILFLTSDVSSLNWTLLQSYKL